MPRNHCKCHDYYDYMGNNDNDCICNNHYDSMSHKDYNLPVFAK